MSEEVTITPAAVGQDVQPQVVGTAESLFGSPVTEPAKVEEPTTEPVVNTPAASENGQPAAVEPTPQPTPLTTEQLEEAKRFYESQGLTLAQAQAQQPQIQEQQPQPRQMTQEEIDRRLNKYTLTQDDYNKIFASENVEDSISALNNVLQKVALQAVTMAAVHNQNEVRQFRATLDPYTSFANQQMEAQAQHEFYTQNPDLKDYGSIVDMVTNELKMQGITFPDREKAFGEVAKRAKERVTQLQQAAGLQVTGQPAQQVQAQPTSAPTQPKKPTMASLPVGGQGGAGSTPSANSETTAQKLFG